MKLKNKFKETSKVAILWKNIRNSIRRVDKNEMSGKCLS